MSDKKIIRPYLRLNLDKSKHADAWSILKNLDCGVSSNEYIVDALILKAQNDSIQKIIKETICDCMERFNRKEYEEVMNASKKTIPDVALAFMDNF